MIVQAFWEARERIVPHRGRMSPANVDDRIAHIRGKEVKIWILNHYAANMYFDKGGRHYSFAKYLKKKGYEPVIFCCNRKHGEVTNYIETDELWTERLAQETGVPFVFVRGRSYQNGKERVLNMIDFYRNVQKSAKAYAKEHGKPDVLYASSVHPLTLVAGLKLAKQFGVKCICEVRDLWPETIVSYSRRFKKQDPLIRLLYAGERAIYQKADALIFTMAGGKKYIMEKGWHAKGRNRIRLAKVHHINNGVDLSEFDERAARYILPDKDLEDEETYKVVYTGTIRRVNNLGIILDAAKEITEKRIRFLIWGDGDEVEYLKKRVITEHISNVVFKGRIGKEYVPSVLKRADLNLLHWEMSSVLRYGVSYNKLFEYLAAGKPIFSTVCPNFSIINKYKCGEETKGFLPEDIASGIMKMFYSTQETTDKMAVNARRAAAEFDFEKLTANLADIIENL